MRLGAVALVLTVLLAVPFLLWGPVFDAAFSPERTRERLESWGSWAWLLGVLLLVADVLVPMPATVVMAALGFLYGPWLGGLAGAAGAFAAGSVAYGACRLLGRGAALWLVGEEDLRRGEALFHRVGGWVVALSRWMPLLPEVVACLAGIVRMPARRFLTALACGSLPFGLAFAAVGHLGAARPWTAFALSAAAPALLWLGVGRILGRLSRPEGT